MVNMGNDLHYTLLGQQPDSRCRLVKALRPPRRLRVSWHISVSHHFTTYIVYFGTPRRFKSHIPQVLAIALQGYNH